MSDGCAGEYKNLDDFGVAAEWHFFATSHGKSAAYGIGGTVKRTATKASLQQPINNQILNLCSCIKFVLSEIKGIHFAFAKTSEHEEEAKLLAEGLFQEHDQCTMSYP